MRYLPNLGSMTHIDRFNPEKRPPSSMLPKALADLLEERDRVAEAGHEALIAVGVLDDEGLDLAAKTKDDLAATQAARAGKPIPKPSAVPKLEADRAEAARVLAAQEAAFTAVISECADHVYLARDDAPTADAADKAKAKARVEIDVLVDKLATAVEAAVAAGAARDWILMNQYHTDARTWPVDVIPDLARHGLSRQNTTPYNVRQIIAGAAHAVMEDQENV
jgi:hypothetical protein